MLPGIKACAGVDARTTTGLGPGAPFFSAIFRADSSAPIATLWSLGMTVADEGQWFPVSQNRDISHNESKSFVGGPGTWGPHSCGLFR
jgi:hypothetical protein